MPGSWEESKHPRNAGKFASGGGGGESAPAGRSPRAAAVAKAAVGAKRGGGQKKDIERAYQHVVSGSYAKDKAESHKEFGKAMALFQKHGQEPNGSAKAIFQDHGFDHGSTGAAATSSPARDSGKSAAATGGPAPGGLNWKAQTHYVGGHDGSGQPIHVPNEGPTSVAETDHGRYMVSNDPRFEGGRWHEAIYYPKDRHGRPGDVQFIDKDGRPNHSTMGAHKSKAEAQAAIAKHHHNVTNGIPSGMVRLR